MRFVCNPINYQSNNLMVLFGPHVAFVRREGCCLVSTPGL
jgi:hypothetical protein